MPYLLATCSESSTGRNMGRANFWTQDEDGGQHMRWKRCFGGSLVFLFQFTRALAVGLIFLSHVWHLELVYGRLIALQESYGEQLPCTHLIRWLLLSLVPAMSALVPASFLNLKALVLAIASALSTALMISAALFWMAITVPLQDLRSVDRGAASVVQSSDLTYAIGSLWRQRLEILLSITCMAANIAAVALDFMFNTELSNFLQIVALSVDGLWTACCITWLSGIRLNAPRVHKDKEVKKEVQYRQPCTCQEAGSCDGCIWEQNVASLARRQILPGQLLDLYAALGGDGDGTPDPHHLRVSKTQSIVAMVLGAEAMPHFEPERSTTGDVVWQAIIPATASRGRDGCGSSLASLLPAGPADLAPRMVTHHWGNRFVDLVAAVVADALGLNHFDTLAQNLSEDHAGRRSEVNKLKEKLWNRGLGDQPYWICAVCINQHSSICNNPRSFCDTVTGQPVPCCECDTPKILNDQYLQCELNKFDDMMMHLYYVHGSAFVQVLAIDRDFEIFSRAWCLAEMVQADACRMDQHVLLHSPEALEKNSARLVSIRVQDCSATRPEDKEAILSNIGGAREQEQFNDRLRDLLLGAKGLLAKWLDGQTNLQGIGAVAARVKAETRAHED
ncbi:unnamed protein product [Effrenium voratum]|uniref:Uncharacterized protein n=1 Tax=Effrenium voratum TaxID=2562239 RepID=A0AA36I1D5_9DINO|nr:unnamed protein product [Effrenium voratum]